MSQSLNVGVSYMPELLLLIDDRRGRWLACTTILTRDKEGYECYESFIIPIRAIEYINLILDKE
jgi:hypothetical protein